MPEKLTGDPAQPRRITLQEAISALSDDAPLRSAAVFEHGTLLVKLYQPRGKDPQPVHTRDELYIVQGGHGTFRNGAMVHPFAAGDALFVPAGVDHRFESFSEDFLAWVVFYGPEGGENR